jgi:hypothetical protein
LNVARQIHPFIDDVFIEQDMDMAVLKCYAMQMMESWDVGGIPTCGYFF